MARKIFDPAGERLAACRAAVELWRAEYGSDNNTSAALQGRINQQALSALMKHNTLGLDLADRIASEYETTVDGLAWLLLRGGKGAVRAGDIPGWARAVEDAMAQWGESRYDLAAEVKLPVAPKLAGARFAYDLAQIFHMHVRVSSVIPAVRKIGT